MKRYAFTIIELLTVISVVAFLSGIALPALSGVVQKSKLSRDINNLRQIGVALRAYQNDHDGNMPPDQGGYFIVSAQGADQALLSYTGSNFEIWHSSFDSRAMTPGDASPVSYSINENVLTPTGPEAALREWNGNLAMSQVPLSQLIVAAPSFRTDGGAFSWDENIASMVYTLSNRVQEMFGDSALSAPPSFYRRIPCLFADGHIELVPVENYQWTAENPANWVQWDPMGTSLSPLPLIAWESDTGVSDSNANIASKPPTSATNIASNMTNDGASESGKAKNGDDAKAGDSAAASANSFSVSAGMSRNTISGGQQSTRNATGNVSAGQQSARHLAR